MERHKKIQWMITNESEDVIKDNFLEECMPLAGKVINSRYITRTSKPWLSGVVKQQPAGNMLPQGNRTMEVKQNTVQTEEKRKIGKSMTNKKGVTLKELCPQDKRRVANLIKELAKAGEERELAVEQLQRERLQFQDKIEMIQKAQEKLIAERDLLKTRIVEHQLTDTSVPLNKNETAQNKGAHQNKVTMEKAEDGSSQTTESSPKPAKTYYFLGNIGQSVPSVVHDSNIPLIADNQDGQIVYLKPAEQMQSECEAMEYPPPLKSSQTTGSSLMYQNAALQQMLSQMPPHLQIQFLMQQTKLQEQQLKLQDQIHHLQQMQMNIVRTSQSDISTIKDNNSSLQDSSADKNTEKGTVRESALLLAGPKKAITEILQHEKCAVESEPNAENIKPEDHYPLSSLPLQKRASPPEDLKDETHNLHASHGNGVEKNDSVLENNDEPHQKYVKDMNLLDLNDQKNLSGVRNMKNTHVASAPNTQAEERYRDPSDVLRFQSTTLNGRIRRDRQYVERSLVRNDADVIRTDTHSSNSKNMSFPLKHERKRAYSLHERQRNNSLHDRVPHMSLFGESDKENTIEKNSGNDKLSRKSGSSKSSGTKMNEVERNSSRSQECNYTISTLEASGVSSFRNEGHQQPRTSTRLDKIIDILSDVRDSNVDIGSQYRSNAIRYNGIDRGPSFVSEDDLQESTILEEVFFVQNSSHR